MKPIFKILGIVLFFLAIGYGLTYPYELAYSGSEDIKIIADSYEFSSLKEIIEREEFKNKVLYIDLSEPFDKSDDKEMDLKYQYMPELIKKYGNKAIAFIYLTRPDSDSGQKQDDLRKWIYGIKKYKLKGHHAVMSPAFFNKIIDDFPEIRNNHFLPHYLIVDKNGVVVNRNAPAPYETEKVIQGINKLLN